MKGKNAFWGIVLLLGAAAMLLGRFGLWGGISIWKIIIDICLVASLLRGVTKGSFGTILFSLAFLIIVNDKLLGLEAITPWPVLGAALLGNIGLNLLFPKFGKHRLGHWGQGKNNCRRGIEEYKENNGYIYYENTFGDSIKYVSGVVGKVDVENTFGSTQIYLTEALPDNHTINVDVETSFGSIVIYVPSVWKVVMNVETAFGNASEKGNCNPFGEDVVYMGGSVNFGNLEIVYVGEERCPGSEAFDMQNVEKI